MLAVNTHDLAIGDHGRRIIKLTILAAVNEPDDRGDPLDAAGNVIEDRNIAGDEMLLEQKIFRRIPGDRHLGKRDNARTRAARPVTKSQDPVAVTVEVTDRRIDLG